MGRMYAVVFSNISVTAAQDLFELLAGAEKPLTLHEVKVTQHSDGATTDSEQLRILIKRVTGAPTSGSGGSTHTPTPLNPGGTAAGFTAEINNTTRLSGGTQTSLIDEAFNVLSGFHYLPSPEARPSFAGQTRCVIGLETAPADALSMEGYAIVEEHG